MNANGQPCSVSSTVEMFFPQPNSTETISVDIKKYAVVKLQPHVQSHT